jgi:phospholipid/cholesterol/gamma-HCH transport system permease protein
VDTIVIKARPWSLVAVTARRLRETVAVVRRLVAFTLITLGTLVTKFGQSPQVMRPMVHEQIFRVGVKLVPIICFLGVTLGMVIAGQTVTLLQQVGAAKFTGMLLVTVVVRELAPLVAGLVVLSRVGTASVIELGTARALGEVEALEALGIDPIHYLVVPRVTGFTVAVVGLTTYFVLLALAGGYAFAFVRGLPLTLEEYFGRIAAALSWADFPLLALKTALFGAVTGLVICYQGLAQPLQLDQVGAATTRTVALCVVGCLCLDALFVPIYLLL